MPKFPIHKRIMPNFLRPTLEIAGEREKTIEDAEFLIAPLPGESAYLHAAREIHERLELQTAQRMAPPSIIWKPSPRSSVGEAMMRGLEAEQRMEAQLNHMQDRIYSCFTTGICQPHRPEPPLRKTVHSTAVEPKQLT